MSFKPRHLWYKLRQNATPIAQAKPAIRYVLKMLPVRKYASYSIVTASRAISLATSSKCAESCSSTAFASRLRHSSSLIAGMSLGTIEGVGLERSV
jgi:hypothetical protein